MNNKLLRISFLLILLNIVYSSIRGYGGDPESTGLAAGKLKTVSGYIKDGSNGEFLIGATVYIIEKNAATSSNQYGFYSLSLPAGKYILTISYVGYQTITQTIDLTDNITLNFEMQEETQEIGEVIVRGESAAEKIRKPEMSVSRLEAKTINKIPALMGEVDLIKAIQLLPGVQPTSEGTSGFSVRGGGIDQNLIILDEAPIYNASHLMGFFSVFNNDAIRDVKLFKGDIPAMYGGRLSSVLDIKMKEGNSKEWTATGGLGLISSRLTVEGPISKDRTSILISGRRTYADLFFPLFPDTDLQKSYMYFYDLNLKINHTLNEKNRLYLSGYMGRDLFGQKKLSDFGFGNQMATLRWNHQFSGILFSNVTFFYSNYNYSLTSEFGGSNYYWNSNISDLGLKADFILYFNPQNEIRFGFSSAYHTIDPVDAGIENDTTGLIFPSLINHSLEHGVYALNQQKIGDKLTIKYGLRFSVFQNMGKTTQNYFDSQHNFLYSKTYKKGEIYNTFSGFEPRLGINYAINEVSAIKASYARTFQYLQLASNSNGGMPLDYWFTSSPNIKPQKAQQWAIGYFRNFLNNTVEFSFETFYKKMTDVIDFKDHAELLFNDRLEGDVRVGSANSYGFEIFLKRNEGKLNGWISYTFTRAFRKIPEINNGHEYPAPYDKPHNIYLVLSYELNKRLTLSTNWIFASGTPATFPVGSFRYGNNLVNIYSNRNEYRLRDYHRMDISLSLKNKIVPTRKWQSEWVFSVYNVYGRHNDWIINFINKNDATQEYKSAERWFLPFVFFPSITWNFKF